MGSSSHRLLQEAAWPLDHCGHPTPPPHPCPPSPPHRNAGGGDVWTNGGVAGGKLYALYAGGASSNQFWSIVTVGTLTQLPTTAGQGGNVSSLPQPSGFRYRGSTMLANVMFAITEEGQGAVLIYRWSSTAWVYDGAPYLIPNLPDRSAVGVALSNSNAYVTTGTGKIYCLDTAARAWLNGGNPVYAAPAGFALRGIALAPVAPSASSSPTMTSSPTASASVTATETRQPDISPTSSGSVTASSSSTPSVSLTMSGTPSSSVTALSTPTPSPSSVNVLAGASIVVARVATGVASTLTTPLLLDALSLGAAPGAPLSLLGTVSMPMLPPSDPSQMRLTVAGTDTRWGGLSRSGDGRMLCVAGIDAAAGSAWAAVRRTVGSVMYDGSIDVSATFNTTMYTTGIFGAASADGSGFWAVGGSGSMATRGVWYITARGTNFRNSSNIW